MRIEKQTVADLTTGYPSLDRPWMDSFSEQDKSYSLPQCRFSETVQKGIQAYAGKTALLYRELKVSFSGLIKKTEAVSDALSAMGVKGGDTVLLCLPQIPELVYLIYAINRIGATSEIIDPETEASDIRRIFKDTRSVLVFIFDRRIPEISEKIPELPGVSVVTVGALESFPRLYGRYFAKKESKTAISDKAPEGWTAIGWKKFINNGRGKKNAFSSKAADTAVICHEKKSDGSFRGTGFSDRVFNSHIIGMFAMHPNHGHGETSVYLPGKEHGSAFIGFLNENLLLGGKILLVPENDDAKVLKQIRRSGVNRIVTDSSRALRLLNSGRTEKTDMSLADCIVFMERRIDAAVSDEIKEKLTMTGFHGVTVNCYMPAECGAPVSIERKNGDEGISLGRPFITDIVSAFVSDEGICRECRYNERGEICIFSPKNMRGYVGEARKYTRDVMREHPDGKTWVHTGAFGYVTVEGSVIIDEER